MTTQRNQPTCYLLGLGSNVKPRQNFPLIVLELLELGQKLALSRVIETEPVGIRSRNRFLNAAAALWTQLPPPELKRRCVAIEEKLGRDRTDPLRKFRDRPADIDILFTVETGTPHVPADKLPPEDYLRLPLLELLEYLGISTPEATPGLAAGVTLHIREVSFGQTPATIYRDRRTGEVVVVQDRS